jgi:hypothetical protein
MGGAPRGRQSGGPPVSDLVYAGIAIAFFAVCAAYTHFCEKVR